MPFLSDATAVSRLLGQLTNMHPRESGDLILTPWDLLEGRGEFLDDTDGDGNPDGWVLGQPEIPDGRHVYAGLTADSCTRQTHRELDHDQPSHVIDYELEDSQPPPDRTSPILASVPRPAPPLLKAIPVSRPGYQGSTALSPYWYAWAYVKHGRLTLASPPVSFDLENGQGIRAPLPDDLPPGIHKVALLLSEPGKSRPNRPGPMRVQHVVDLRFYEGDSYDLTGPYRRKKAQLAPTQNETRLQAPGSPLIRRVARCLASRVGRYYAKIVWTDDAGSTLAGETSVRTVEVHPSERFNVRDKDGVLTFAAGMGLVEIERPRKVPKGASGWKIFLYIQPTGAGLGYSGGWRLVVDRFNNQGDEVPFPLGRNKVATAGWQGDEEFYGNNDFVVCRDADLPIENTTGIENPEDEPEAPTPIGVPRPESDRIFVRVTDVVNGVESLPSRAVSLEIGDAELLNVVFQNEHNRVKNPTFVETDPEDLPMHWDVDKTNSYAFVDGQELYMGTNGLQTGATGEARAHAFPVDNALSGHMNGELTLNVPKGGAIKGQVQVLLRELDSKGASLATRQIGVMTDPGDHEYKFQINPASSTQTPKWSPDTVEALIYYRFIGTEKNLEVVIRDTDFRQHRHAPRKPKRSQLPIRFPRPVLSPVRTALSDPPEPPVGPDTYPARHPDRPLSTGSVEESQNFDAGIPASFAQVATGGATVGATAAAALAGTAGLEAKKAVSGTVAASAYAEKAYPSVSPHPRHAIGSALKNRMAAAPADGRISMHELCRPSDKARFAWLDASSAREVVELTLGPEPPVSSGPVGINLAAAATQLVAVGGQKQILDLTVAAPTQPGTGTLVLDGVAQKVSAGGTQQQFGLTITSLPTTPGRVTLTVNGTTRTIRVARYLRRRRNGREVSTPTTTARIAEEIKDAGYPGYRITRSGSTLTFTANLPGPRPAPAFSPGTTRLGYSLLVATNGGAETADEFAARIRAKRYPGWTASTGATAAVVRFTAAADGAKGAFSFQPGTTGATSSSIGQVQAGSIDSPSTLAATIRGTAFTGWTVSGSGLVARFTADTPGVRQRSTFDPKATGAAGTMRTITQGTATDVLARVSDRTGKIRQKKILASLATTTIFNTDVTVSGAGTDRAVVSFWASTGTDPLKLAERFEDVDLTGYPAGHLKVGVTEESSAGLTWELHSDNLSVTDRGSSWFRDHNARGRWLNQIEAYYGPSQPAGPDLLLQDARAAVIPGATYCLSAFIRADVADSAPPAFPLVVRALDSKRGLKHRLGCVTDAATSSAGLSGLSSWTEHKLVFTVPADCHVVKLDSQSIGGGAYVIQEVVLSPGTTPNRSHLYATLGSYVTTFDLGTPDADPNLKFWNAERIDLGALVDNPDASHTLSVTYASADPDPLNPEGPGTMSTQQTNPDLVPDKRFVRTYFSATGTGADTPRIRTGSPYAEYVLKIGSEKRMSVLLSPERAELPGGTAFAQIDEWYKRDPEGRRLLPSGRLADDPNLFPAVGHLPECQLLVFNETTKRLIEEHWKRRYVLEQYGREAITLKLSAQPEFVRDTITVNTDPATRRRYAIWRASLAPSEVLREIAIPL